MANIFRQPSDEGVIHAAPNTVPCSKEVGRWVLVATILGSSMAMIDGTAVNVALPALQRDLSATVADVQWIVEAYALFLAALILVGGSLGDHFGRKRIFALGVAIFTVASIFCGFSQSITQLIIARAIQGVGGALLVPGSLAIISTTFSKEQRGKAIGTWSGFSVITGALGPVLGGWLVEHVSWRAVFFLNIPLAILVLVVLFWRVPESFDTEGARKLDWRGALLIVVGLGSLVYGLITSTTLSLFHPLVLSTVLVGVLLLIAFLLSEARNPAPMVPLSLFHSQTFSGANLFTFLLYTAMGSVLFFLPFNLIQVQGYSATAAGAAMLPMILMVFLLSRWSGGLVNRYGAKLPMIIGPIIASIGFALLARPTLGGTYWITFFPALLVLALGISTTVTPLTTTVMGAVESQHAGLASGINNAISRLAALLSVAILSIVLLSVFVSYLNGHLTTLGIAPAAQQQLDAQQNRLVGMQIPTEITGQARIEVKQTISDSFVAAFRVVMLIASSLALMSALIAGLTIQVSAGRGQPERVGVVGKESVKTAI
jgi:EmrB/QacA subfamily drug resistance transporter